MTKSAQWVIPSEFPETISVSVQSELPGEVWGPTSA